MRETEDMGQEVGHHYEVLGKRDHKRAIKIFKYHFFNKFPSGGNIFNLVSPSI